MSKKKGMPRNPVCGKISSDIIKAKESLRDRLFMAVEKEISVAISHRLTKRTHPAPGINLVGIGIGEKVTEGKRTGEMCVKVLVAKKYPKGKVSQNDRIPSDINGIPTDIEGVGYPYKFQIPQRQRHRPTPGGVSAGPDLNAVNYKLAGTLGVLVADKVNNQRLFALSNNHVFADENRINNGAGIVQPSTLDGGMNPDRVATLSSYVPLKFNNRRNWMDAAMAELDNPNFAERNILGIGVPVGSAKPTLGLLVRKSGRTTGLTEGIVRAVSFDAFSIQYDSGLVRVDDIIIIEGILGAFSQSGDSGSAIVDAQGRVVALLFAGSDVTTFAIPMQRVLKRFKVRIAT